MPRWRRQLPRQAPADVRERPPVRRHLEPVRRRTDGLRGEARVVQANLHPLGAQRILGAVDERVRVAVAERVHAVEQVLGPQVPEVAMVEDRVDHRRRVARLDATDVGPPAALSYAKAIGVGPAGRPVRMAWCTPCEETTLFVSRRSRIRGPEDSRAAGRGSPPGEGVVRPLVVEVGSASGIAAGWPSSSGWNRTRSKPGLTWFFFRGSAPARSGRSRRPARRRCPPACPRTAPCREPWRPPRRG